MNTYVEKLGKVSITVDADLWSYDKSYDKLTIVKYVNGSTSGVYLSRVDVPEHTAIDAIIPNEEGSPKYWLELINSLTAEGVDIVDVITEELTQDGIIRESINTAISVAIEPLPTKQWVEDKGYLTEHQDISGKADKSDTYTKSEVYSKEETYNTSEVYTKSEVLEEIASAIISNSFEIYESLEDITTPKKGIIYLIGPEGQGADKYNEYIYITVSDTDTFVKIGDTTVDLSGKADKVADATNNNFASLDSNGNLKDSGKSSSSFTTPTQVNALTSYVVCNTESDTAKKEITITDYSLVVGGNIKVKFVNKNTASSGVELQINSLTPITLKYNNDDVNDTNTWDDNEIVNLFYDGSYFQAYNVEGGGLLNKTTIPSSSQASERKGLTEKTIALAVEALQENIDTIAASSSTVGISGSIARFVLPSAEPTPTETLNITGTCNPATAIMTLQRVISGVWTNVGEPSESTNRNVFTVNDLPADSDYAYRFHIVNKIRNTIKTTGDSYIYYVRPIYTGALLTSVLNITDPEETYYIADFNALKSQLTALSSPVTSARRTYSVGFDDNARRVIMINPKVNVTNIRTGEVYMTSVINTNKMPFTLITSTHSLARLMDSNYNIYISNNSYNPGGSRNIICQ